MTLATTPAVRALQLSKLDPSAVQREMMGNDLDLEKLRVYLQGQLKFEVAEDVIDLPITRTIEGASTVTVSITDYNYRLLNSGLLNAKLDINIDGLWFRLVKVAQQEGSSVLDLTFEDREIAVLRTYPKAGAPHKGVKFALRSKVTRAEFILNLIREVKEFKIPVVIPELHRLQPIEVSANSTTGRDPVQKGPGLALDVGIQVQTPVPGAPILNYPQDQRVSLTVKSEAITAEQTKNAQTILDVGVQLGVRRKLLVCAIMTAITESTLHNYSGGDADSVGLFQQRASWGSYSDRHDPETSSRLFYKAALRVDNSEPNVPYWWTCADIQHPRDDLRTKYGDYRTEAERIVTAYGIPGSDSEGTAASANGSKFTAASGSEYFYYRGTPTDSGKVWKREDSWTCIQRLAQEVNWRAFFVSGVFYLMPDDDLYKTQPIMTIDHTSQGIDSIGFDYDIGKKVAQVSMTAHVGIWIAPPGAVVVLQHMGPVSGRWLLTDFSRTLFDPKAAITLKKPEPALPEPLDQGQTAIPTWAQDSGSAIQDPGGKGGSFSSLFLQYPLYNGGKFMAPLPTDPHLERSEYLQMDGPEGVPDGNGGYHHGAKDWFAPGGTRLAAPIDGTIVEVKPSTSNTGQVFGGVVKIVGGDGYMWVFRHVEPVIDLSEGVQVSQGEEIATVVRWADNPSSSHAHIEIWRTIGGGYVMNNLVDPVLYIQGKAR